MPIEISHIVPVPLLDLVPDTSTVHLVLAHLCEDEKYSDFYCKKADFDGHTIILDNSNFELGDDAFTPDQLMEIGEKVGATYIMAPEYYRDATKTADAMEKFLKVLDRDNFKAFGTLHGMDIMDIRYCLERFLNRQVEGVGFSCRLDPTGRQFDFIKHPNKSFELALKRYLVVRIMQEDFRLTRDTAHFHLLGLNSPLELTFNHEIVRSCDTSAAYIYAINGMNLQSINTRKPSEKVDFADVWGLGFEDRIRGNMAVLETHCI